MSDANWIEKAGLDGKPGKVIGTTYEAGSHTIGDTYGWKKNLPDREKYIKYLTESERYWYLDNEKWFGSEKRKKPA